MVPGRPVQRRGYMQRVLKDEQEFARPRRQMELAQGQGQIILYPEAGGWEGKGWYEGAGAVSLGKRRSGGRGYCLQLPRELGSSRPWEEKGGTGS